MDELIIPDVIFPLLSEAILLVEILLHLHHTHHFSDPYSTPEEAALGAPAGFN